MSLSGVKSLGPAICAENACFSVSIFQPSPEKECLGNIRGEKIHSSWGKSEDLSLKKNFL